MAAVDLDLILHQTVRLFMREGGISADQAFDTAGTVVLDVVAEITDDAVERNLWRTLLPELRESILPAYRKPQPDLRDLEPMIRTKIEAAAKRQRRRQLGGRP